MNKVNKKYLIIGIVSVLIILIGLSVAYWVAVVQGEGREMTFTVETLKIKFTDDEIINDTDIPLGWTKIKEFTVENLGKSDYIYQINIEELINTLVTDSLEYRITSEDETAYKMEDYKLIQKCPDKCTQVIGKSISIKSGETHRYQIEFRYPNKEFEDQTDDQEKEFKGKLSITRGKKRVLADFFEEKYPNATSRKDFKNADEEGAVHIEEGDYTEGGAKVYYWTGNVNDTPYDNWVKFGQDSSGTDLWWRIIRTNEDGGLRLLYHGTGPDVTNAYIGTSAYNSTSNNPMYVGYMYGTTGNNNTGLTNNRANSKDSTIKGVIDKWYEDNLKVKGYDKYISKTAIYCNDRNTKGYQTSSIMYYAAYDRLYNKNHPSFKCGLDTSENSPTLYSTASTETERKRDMFTTSNSSDIGNEQLQYPIALMTADEVVYAGGLYGQNSKSYYYYNNANGNSIDGYWWTMSPYFFNATYSYVYGVTNNSSSNLPGNLSGSGAGGSTPVVRPVLSIKACATLKGSGTTEDPYIPEIDDTCAKADN